MVYGLYPQISIQYCRLLAIIDSILAKTCNSKNPLVNFPRLMAAYNTQQIIQKLPTRYIYKIQQIIQKR